MSSQATSSTSCSPSKQSSPSYRLLYRGAISLPDSHLLLDGLTFSAYIDSNASSTPNSSVLLDNPLALALESMRGRPSLRMMSVVNVKDVLTDESPCVFLDIHPLATLSRIYFQNMFCLSPLESDTSDCGIKIALGDTDGPETTYIMIYARKSSSTNDIPMPTPSTSDALVEPPLIELMAARLTTIAPASTFRLPRPDDPTPRQPPELIRRVLDREASKRTQLAYPGTVSGLGIKTTSGKIGKLDLADVPPPLPNGKGKGKDRRNGGSVNGSGKQHKFSHSQSQVDFEPQSTLDMSDGTAEGRPESQLERANKNVIKQATVTHLTSANRLRKTDSEFKEVFGWIYRGVAFALRKQIKITAVDVGTVERFVKMHATMYVVDTAKKKSK